MRYILAVVLPPLAVLFSGKPFQAVLNLALCCFLWLPGVVHALAVVSSAEADRRQSKLIRALGGEEEPPPSLVWSLVRVGGGVVGGLLAVLVVAVVVAARK